MKKYLWILPLLAFVTMVVMTFWILIPAEESEKELQERLEVEELKRENQMLLQANDLLDDKIIVLEKIMDSISGLLAEDGSRIEHLKTTKDERIRAMDDYTDDELYRYFTGFKTKSTSDRE